MKLHAPILAFVLLPAFAHSATLRVPSEYPTIQSAIDASVSGDSVLVAPGTYTNCDWLPCTANVALMKSGVALVSEGGPEVTIVRVDTPAGGVSMVRGAGVAGVLLKGFTITGTASFYRGAAFVSCQGVEVEDCHFVDLAGGLQDGGGLFANGSTIEVRGCEFRRCEAVLEAGGYKGVNSSSIVEDCFFEECEPGAAVLVGLSSSSAAVRGSVFRNNTRNAPLAVLDMPQAEVSDNVFEGNTSPMNAAALSISTLSGYALVERNLFVGNTATFQTSIVSWSTSGEVRGNTFFGNTALPNRGVFAHWAGSDQPTIAANNILSGNVGGPAYRAVVSLPQASCNLFWANPGGDYEGYVPSLTDVFADPQFCDTGAGDFSVAASSPCLPENNFGCGTIGVFGAGCDGRGTVTVGVATVTLGFDLVVDGDATQSRALFNWIPGSAHSFSVPTVVDDGERRYDFSQWEDGGSDSMRAIVVPDVPTLYTAAYDSLFWLNVTAATPEGSVAPESGYRTPFSMVEIAATPDSAFFLARWEGEGNGSYSGHDSVATVTMAGPISEVAHFSTFTDVTITSDPVGLPLVADGEEFVTPRTFVWERNTWHWFSTEPVHHEQGSGERLLFLSWSDGEASQVYDLDVPADPVTVSALYETEYLLTFQPTPQGELTPGDGWWDAGSAVEIEAIENPHYLFTEWEGAGAGSYSGPENPATVTMNGPIHEVAHFGRTAQEATLSLSASDPFVHSGSPVGFGNVYVWYVCSTEGGFSTLDAELAGTMTVFAFLSEPGILNGGSGSTLEITATKCLSGPALLGAVLVQDPGGELSLIPHPGTGVLRTRDCSTPSALPFDWPLDLQVTNVRTDGGPVVTSGRGCDEEAPTPVAEPTLPLPEALSMSPPRPNPMRGGGRTRFEFALPRPGTVRLAIYDVSGRVVAARGQEVYTTGGVHSIDWDPGLHSSGVYYVRLTLDAGESVGTRWVVLR